LNPKEIDSLPPGTYGDFNNLYLVVKPTGARSYMLRYQWQGHPQKMGLGAADKIKLADARDKAIDANRLLAKGANPRDNKLLTARHDDPSRTDATVSLITRVSLRRASLLG
jgi:hypothetical protein